MLISTFYVLLIHLYLLRSTVFKLLTILMIRGCTSIVHPLIIKIFNNSETVDRRKNLWKQKLLISTFYVWLTYFFTTIIGFWVNNNLDDQTMYILRSWRSLITQKRLVGEKTYENKSCLSWRITSNLLIFSHCPNSESLLAPNRCHSSECWHVSEHVIGTKTV